MHFLWILQFIKKRNKLLYRFLAECATLKVPPRRQRPVESLFQHHQEETKRFNVGKTALSALEVRMSLTLLNQNKHPKMKNCFPMLRFTCMLLVSGVLRGSIYSFVNIVSGTLCEVKTGGCVFAGRLEGCGYHFGEGRRAGSVLTARMLPAERSGGGRGGEGKTGDTNPITPANEVMFLLEFGPRKVVCFFFVVV